MLILDTNVLSELSKAAPSERVLRWLKSQAWDRVHTTAISQAEILRGIESLPEGRRRNEMRTASEQQFQELPGRILPFDEPAARAYAEIAAARKALGRPISQSDAMIAAIARAHDATVVTRDAGGFTGCGVRVVDPWHL